MSVPGHTFKLSVVSGIHFVPFCCEEAGETPASEERTIRLKMGGQIEGQKRSLADCQ